MKTPLLEQLEESVGSRNILSGEALAARSNGFWDSSPLRAVALTTPENIEQLIAIVKCCQQHKQPMVVQGGLTGTVKGQLAQPDEVAISLEKMSAIIDYDPIGKTVTAEAGCTLQQIQDFAQDKGLLFPVDIGSRGSCTIGGNIATNAGGMEVLRYGMMRNHILGLEAVLPDGKQLSAMNRMQKNNTGLDLKHLLIGSEGILGIITSAVLQLKPRPKSCSTAFIACRNFQHVTTLLDSAQRTLGENLTRFELMDRCYYNLLTGPGHNLPPVNRDCEWYVLLESMGFSPQQDSAEFQQWLEKLMEEGQLADAAIAQNSKQREDMWTIREVFDVALAEKPYFLYDVSLPLDSMPVYLAEVKKSIYSTWSDALFFIVGHVADGNLHFFLSPRAGNDTTAIKKQADQLIYSPLAAIGGSISAEHGIGMDKKGWLHLSRNEAELQLMKSVKTLLDPNHLLNPGRIFDP